MTATTLHDGWPPCRVSLVAIPDAAVSTIMGLYDAMNSVRMMGLAQEGAQTPFEVEVVGEREGYLELASGLPVRVQRAVSTIETSDIVIVPSVLLSAQGWQKGRYPQLVAWLRKMHERGAVLCSACSGIFLLGETGLFEDREATVHFIYSRSFAAAYPGIKIHPERVLVVSGSREDLVSSGASTSWHDLVLYLISRYAGAATAQQVARVFALQWHQEGLSPYVVFDGCIDHDDAEIAAAQKWLDKNFSAANPVEEMIRHSVLAERTFRRRFVYATGLTPLAYVHRLRVEDAKRRLERTESSVDEISWRVGYEDPAFFRRLFKRITGLAPGHYRKRFRMPDFARHEEN